MLKKEIIIVPSLLAANFSCLDREIEKVSAAGATILHLDVMDGHFVPNISFGSVVVKSINESTTMTLDTHLMIENPDNYLEQFKDAGSNILTIHAEACSHIERTISKIKDLGMSAGVSIKPDTPLTVIEELIPLVDLVLIMSVHPGFGGQKFIHTSIQKIKKLSSIITENNLSTVIEVDGGIDLHTAKIVKDAGAHYLVAGNAVFGNGNVKDNYTQLTTLIR